MTPAEERRIFQRVLMSKEDNLIRQYFKRHSIDMYVGKELHSYTEPEVLKITGWRILGVNTQTEFVDNLSIAETISQYLKTRVYLLGEGNIALRGTILHSTQHYVKDNSFNTTIGLLFSFGYKL